MGDVCDASDADIEMTRDTQIAAIRRAAANIPVGTKGHCKVCGNYTKRLVTGICAPCRDKALVGYAKGRN
jgi:hypothetical protein